MHGTLGSTGNGWHPWIHSVNDAIKCFMSSCGCVHGCGREGIHDQKMTRCQSRLHVACGCCLEDSVVDVCASNPGHTSCTSEEMIFDIR